MKKIIKPFWSYNIIKIEKWLSKMAKEGYMLNDVNMLTRVFTFEKGEPKDLIYKICYENKGVKDISNSLKNHGWKAILSKQRWIFTCHESKEEIKINPSREILLKRNRNIKTVMWSIIFLYVVMYLPILLILGFAMGGVILGLIPVEYDNTPVVENSEPYMVSYMVPNFIFLAFLFAIYTVIKLNKLDKQIRKENKAYILENNKDKSLRDNKKIVKKIKPGWFYSPDKTEKWLEDMESKGFNLYRTNKLGSTFYFTNGTPRKVKYRLDYQNSTNETYYELHKENGWKLTFKTLGSVMQWCIWSKEYEGVEPDIYTDKEELASHAKKVFIVHSIIFVPILIFYVYNLILDIPFIINGNGYLFSTLIQLMLLIEFGIFYKNVVGYYLRTKKKVT